MFEGSNSGQVVIPYNSDFSALAFFINSYSDLGPRNMPTMPLNKPPLSREKVQLIKDWINRGAPDINGNIKWANDRARKKLYAVNQGCDVVTVFDSETQMPMRYIPVGNKPGPDTPHQVRVSDDGEYWYVIFVNNNIMQKFRCSDDSYVGDIPLSPYAAGTSLNTDDDAADWNTFAITNDGKFAYCVSWTQNGKISLVDLQERKLVKYVGGQYFPHAITLSPSNDKVYIGAQTGNFIVEWDKGLNNAEEIPLEAQINYQSSLDPHDLIFSPDGSKMYITCSGSNEVREFDPVSKTVSRVIPTAPYPQEIIYSEVGDQYFVSCPGASPDRNNPGFVTRFSATALQPSNLKCGFQPHGIAADKNKKLLYVLSRNVSDNGPTPHHTGVCNGRNGFVNFIDLNTLTILSKKYELSVDPYFIFARP